MTISLAPGATGIAGDSLIFRHTATNTGTEAFRGVLVTNLYPGLGTLDYAWPGEPGVLLPGQSVVITAAVVITPQLVGTTISSNSTVSALTVDGGELATAAAAASITLPAEVAPVAPVVPDLPNTGAAPLIPGGLALLVILAGLLLTVAARRRSTSRKVTP